MTEAPLQWQVFRARLDPIEGSEQAGTRPVLIVSREAVNRVLTVVTIVPLTTRKAGRTIHPTEAQLPAGAAGQPSESIVLAHQVRTVAKVRLLDSYGFLTDELLREDVRRALRVHLDLL